MIEDWPWAMHSGQKLEKKIQIFQEPRLERFFKSHISNLAPKVFFLTTIDYFGDFSTIVYMSADKSNILSSILQFPL